MKFIFDYLPIIAFFIAYYIPDNLQARIFIATATAIIASILQVLSYRLIFRRVEKTHLLSLGIILVLGSITLLTQDKRYFLWKPTVINWLFAILLFGSQFVTEKNIMQRIMEKNISIPAHAWVKLNYSWAIFFLAMGAINLYIAFNFAEHIWVNFKLFGMLGLTLLFAMMQALFISKYLQESEKK